jgi:hypothetical protein
VKLTLAPATFVILAISSSLAIAQTARPAAAAAEPKEADRSPAAMLEKPPKTGEPVPVKKGSRVEVTTAPTGKLTLVVHYPWHVHRRASVEVQLTGDQEAELGRPAPLGFVTQWMKGDVTNAVYAAREGATAGPSSKKMTAQHRDFTIRGSLNALAKRGVCVVFPEQHATDEGLLKKHLLEEGPRAIFCLLDSWAVDGSTLCLELPAVEFAKPGSLRVWFLREGDVVWSETVQWPGSEK